MSLSALTLMPILSFSAACISAASWRAECAYPALTLHLFRQGRLSFVAQHCEDKMQVGAYGGLEEVTERESRCLMGAIGKMQSLQVAFGHYR